MSLKDTILAAKDRASEVVTVPEWGVDVELRSFSGTMRQKLIEAITAAGFKDGQEVTQAAMIAAIMPLFAEILVDSVFDPDTGERVFGKADADAIADKAGDVVERLALKALVVSKLGGGAVDAAGKPSLEAES